MIDVSAALREAQCKYEGPSTIGDPAVARVLQALLRAFGRSPEATIFSRPSLTGSSAMPPDLVVLDLGSASVHVLRVEACPVDVIDGSKPEALVVRPPGKTRGRKPMELARHQLADITAAADRDAGYPVGVGYVPWVAFPNVGRDDWEARFPRLFGAPTVLFSEDVDPGTLRERLRAAGRTAFTRSRGRASTSAFVHVRAAFGDSAVLFDAAREVGAAGSKTLGERFDALALVGRRLSTEQQSLAERDWTGGPRLVRGVAGSGKTVVLATNLARRLERDQHGLFDRPRRYLAVCSNRALVPFIEGRISAAWQQRVGRELAPGRVDVRGYEQLLAELAGKGMWSSPIGEAGAVARCCKAELDTRRALAPAAVDAASYDAIWVDEAEDLHPDAIRLLIALCRTPAGAEPNLYLFYDDAQNLHGRPRPVWDELGLHLTGRRSSVMIGCPRNTVEIVEPAFNVLLGTGDAPVATRGYADVRYLVERGAVDEHEGWWEVGFCERHGPWPLVSFVDGEAAEDDHVAERLGWLLVDQGVRAEDILVLATTRERLTRLQARLRGRLRTDTLLVDDNSDRPPRNGRIVLSTVGAAKGYDAFAVLIASADRFASDVSGRAAFYVACTRAREHLEVSSVASVGYGLELERAIAACRAQRG